MNYKNLLITLICGLLGLVSAYANDNEVVEVQRDTLRYQIYFVVAKHDLRENFRDNKMMLEAFNSNIKIMQESFKLRKVTIVASASPEGGHRYNQLLSERRAKTLKTYLVEKMGIADSLIVVSALGANWEALPSMVLASNTPYKEQVVQLIKKTPLWTYKKGKLVSSRKRVLMNFRGGRPWRFMMKHIFPDLRNSTVVECVFEKVEKVIKEEKEKEVVEQVVLPEPVPVVEPEPQPEPQPEPVPVVEEKPGFCMSIRSNLVYDALLLPNIGAEFHLGKGWALGLNYMHAWWNSQNYETYYRLYGVDILLRKYFGKVASEYPLSGHHLGVYSQIFTYDFSYKGKGVLGGLPGKYLWDRAIVVGGLDYGYALPITKSLNMDFSLGIAFGKHKYYKYHHLGEGYFKEDGEYSRYAPVPKAEISLVWLIGKGKNYKNRAK